MPEEEIERALAKARVFFERAGQVALTNNFDYAIDLYLEGLRCAPDALEEGHLKLHELALARSAKGGKKPSVGERIKRLRGKTPLEQMINAEYLFAMDPDHLPYAEAILKATVAADYRKTARWIADMVFEANNAVDQPSVQTYLLLKDSYEALGLLERAVLVCRFALTVQPDDKLWQDEYQRLSAELTVAKGKYDHAEDFRESIKDRQMQEKLQSQESIVKTMGYRLSAVEDARAALAKDSESPRNILDFVYALADLEQDQADNEALELLDSIYKKTKNFIFKQQAGQIRIKQLRRRIRQAKDSISAGGDIEQGKEQLEKLQAQLADFELEHYRLCVENYPTDTRYKYEYAVRLMDRESYDQAIPLFQQAQRDPAHRIAAMSKMGLCFLLKGWYADAIDVLRRALESYALKEDDIAKELWYNLGWAYQASGDTDKALETYRRLAQTDFAYKDVSQRVDQLRSSKEKPTSQ